MRMVELDDTELEMVGGGQLTASQILLGLEPLVGKVAPNTSSQFNAAVAQALEMLGQGRSGGTAVVV